MNSISQKHIEKEILKETVSDYEKAYYKDLIVRLENHFKPQGMIENTLVDRIGLCILRLYRSGKAENEFMKATLNPRIVETVDPMDMYLTRTVVKNEGYEPKVKSTDIKNLNDTFLRYDIALENRLFKAIHELQRLQAIRNGDEVPPTPPTLKIEMDKEG